MLLLVKNSENCIEYHYNREDKNLYLQYINVSEVFFSEKIKNCLEITKHSNVDNDVYNEYSVYDNLITFDYLIDSSFYNFFNNNFIDIPKCFKNTKSVKRKVNEVKLLKMNNYLMRDGKRYTSYKYLLSSFFEFFKNNCDNKFKIFKVDNSWKDIYLVLSQLNFNNSKYLNIRFSNEITLTYGNKLNISSKEIDNIWNLRDMFFHNLQDLKPLFSFYIYKVDKKIFKNTRGKSGKYTFIWKYVSPYKRLFLVMHWLMKELRVKPGRTLNERLLSLFTVIALTPTQTWMYKVKKFSHNYVYKNCRRTLAETYKTSTK